ncbi:hypothetical protein TPHA_0A04100 [Tetrapisispora phaffii CBS 4417]|uniref:Mitochondrial chaperone TCM62 n=1 Tax=Tetrapisispora phaffii (strain ATCC 24235 / CBS 4417 / NBRC 1672 / NRRL Y-8282 / UCD 70-5) TaxID=1071381 RepID=G8BNK7_TETPH|nr:hypothetical protein TPHA_0A04100 [Tetrapisispora phaffii CBS 4417]CCE61485.1 hypothetical protein TPHA_0A04100 [Tetrapisispora phaffii CBS 4417]
MHSIRVSNNIYQSLNVFSRTLKTLHTPVYKINTLPTREILLQKIIDLDNILCQSSHNKFLLYQWKYRNTPQLITSDDYLISQKVVKDYIESLQQDDANSKGLQRHKESKLGKIGIQLFLECHNNNVTQLSTSLATGIMKIYNKNPSKSTLEGIKLAFDLLRNFLNENKIQINDKEEVNAVVKKQLNDNEKDIQIVNKVLESIDYNLFSDDIVRFVRGNTFLDNLEVTKGWKFCDGIIASNEPYLRSLDIPKKKLVSIDSDLLVLMVDGKLTEANKILPSIKYATRSNKSLVLIIDGEVKGDALAAISMNNNKNKRNNNVSRTIILKYNPASFNGISLQENHSLINYLKLPLGVSSIYSPNFSEFAPSKVSADNFFGSLNSIKATTGEAFLYSDSSWDMTSDPDMQFIRKTVTVHVGASSKVEIDQRIGKLDNLVNNILCNGLAEGFLPSYGTSLIKCIPLISKLESSIDDTDVKLGINAVMDALQLSMISSLKNLSGHKLIQVTNNITETAYNSSFEQAKIGNTDEFIDLVKLGILEPWNKVDTTLQNTLKFINAMTSFNIVVSKVFEKPKKE